MSVQKIVPYLNFDGTAAEAIKHYEAALGARPDNVMRFGDVADMKTGPEHKDRIMHAVLFVDSTVLMLSDTMPGQPAPKTSNTHVCVQFDEPTDMAKKFDALAKGGQITFPLHDTFWGAKFGMLTDKFGIHWMFNCEMKKP